MNRYLAANGQAAGMVRHGRHGRRYAGLGRWRMGGNSMAAETSRIAKAFLAGTPEAEVYLARQRRGRRSVAGNQSRLGYPRRDDFRYQLRSAGPNHRAGARSGVRQRDQHTMPDPAGFAFGWHHDSGVTLGQQRALAVWRRIIYPDGSSISIDNMPGADVGGYAGFK